MTTTECFTDWLDKQIERKDPIGAVARYVRDDPCWRNPGRPRLRWPDEVDDHLVFHQAPYEITMAMRQAWQEWERARQ